jgi:glutathione S-transferase
MAAPLLVGTPLSHFTRKIRVLALELGIELEMRWSPGVLTPAGEAYGDNPLLRVPALIDGDVTVIDSDHIARYLVGCHDPADRFGVRCERVADGNRLAVIGGIMADEVTLLLAQRAGGDVSSGYFVKRRDAIVRGLAWLDANTGDGELDYRDIALVCMWQHLLHYRIVALEAPNIAARVARFADRPSVRRTAPEAALADARAAGWQPG